MLQDEKETKFHAVKQGDDMRIGVADILQETNTFSPLRTPLAAFEHGYLLEDAEIPARLAESQTPGIRDVSVRRCVR
jgi:microcystin degradation protein MlrC